MRFFINLQQEKNHKDIKLHMQILYTLYFIPSIIAMMWTISFALRKRETRQTVFMLGEALSILYFVSYALYIHPNVDYSLMVRLDAINIPLALLCQAFIVMYMHMHYSKAKKIEPWYVFLSAPALILGSISGTLYYLIGFDRAAELTRIFDATGSFPQAEEMIMKTYNAYHITSEYLFNIMSITFGLIVITLCINTLKKEGYKPGDVYRFFFQKKDTTPPRIISVLLIANILLMLPLAILGRTFMMNNAAFSLTTTSILSLVIYFTGYVESYSVVSRSMTLHSLANINLSSNTPEEETEEEKKGGAEESSHPTDSTFMAMTYEKFKHLMEEDCIYRDENLTLITLSEFMGVGRTTISQMVKHYYGMSFRDVLNKYRINAAMQYMHTNPKATQDVVAMECGYKNGNYLNSKFKEIVGETPLMWLANQAPNNEQNKGEQGENNA